ncbi:MAG: sigma-54 dependent transcriptional regulator [Acidobacteriota bacterium]
MGEIVEGRRAGRIGQPPIDEAPLEFGGGIAGVSQAIRSILGIVARVAQSDSAVLIEGESGTGKELVAREIHRQSRRRDRVFVTENCAALTESLIESELFGHVRGAFTGASRDRLGIFQLADGGTLFLDEIGEMSLSMQGKFLRALQEGEVRPVGGRHQTRVNVRILAASNRNLKDLMRAGRFRQDLYYRLNVICIVIPPLRERREDIPHLIRHFIRKISSEQLLPEPRISQEALTILTSYHWPGNVRELQNAIERASLMQRDHTIHLDCLPPEILDYCLSERRSAYGKLIKNEEQLMIEAALRTYGGDKSKTARSIGWNRPKLYRRIKALGIPLDYGRGAAAGEITPAGGDAGSF